MRVLLLGRLLEAGHTYALRIHSTHDVTDGAVLAGAVEALQTEQHAVRSLSRQAHLVRGEELHTLCEECVTVSLRDEVRLVCRVEVLRHRDLRARPHAGER